MTTAIVFLEDNGYIFFAKEGEIEKLALAIITEHLDTAAIAAGLKNT